MVDGTLRAGGGWQVGESCALELDTVLSAAGGRFAAYPLGELLGFDPGQLPRDWLDQWPEFLGQPGRFVSLMSTAASLAGVLLEPEYEQMARAVRELTVADALEALVPRAAALGVAPRPDLSLPSRLADLTLRVQLATYRAHGLEMADQGEFSRNLVQDLEWLPAVLRGGARHGPFWHWLDRLYSEYYRPWREGRGPELERLRAKAGAALGALTAEGRPPALGWLPATNPLLRYSTLGAGVQAGLLRVFFWVEPFGLSDLWFLDPGLVGVAFAEPGPLIERCRELSAEVAARVRALADPTRLQILRLIRHFGMDNTEMAAYLGLARPTVSVHAKVLREAGLIESWQEGREVRHSVRPGAMRQLFRDLAAYLDLPENER